jgi:excisionase family DNA binding protein
MDGRDDTVSLLKVRQVAERLNVGVSTVYELLERGRLPHYRVAKGALRVSEEQIATYLEGCQREPRTGRPAKPKSPKRPALEFFTLRD